MGSKDTPQHDGERRGKPRYNVRFAVNYRYGDAYLYSRASNASEFGIFLVSAHTLPLGSAIRLEFEIPSAREPVTVSGEVVWVEDGSGGQDPGMGIKFVDLDPEKQRHLRSLVRVVACID
jgi:uncharacterized protein (TIGR02266 family)